MVFRFADKRKPVKTKDRILLEAAILFAHHGYSAVSIRDIAERVKIKSASIYAHFSSKEEIFDVIVDNIKEIYLEYYQRNEEMLQTAASYEEVLDCLFAELKEIYNIYIYYGVSLIVTEQFSNAKARDVLNNVLIKVGIHYIKAKLDECIKKKWVKKFDTRTIATLLMNSILFGTLMRTHEDMKQKTAYNVTKMFTSLHRFMLDSVEIIK